MTWSPKLLRQRQLQATARAARVKAFGSEEAMLKHDRLSAEKRAILVDVTRALKRGTASDPAHAFNKFDRGAARLWSKALFDTINQSTIYDKLVRAQAQGVQKVRNPVTYTSGAVRGTRAHTLILDDILDFKAVPESSDDHVDAMKYAISAFSLPVVKPESVIRFDGC